jgi:ATP-dependent exoDNAse (exonuclease V) alpha subunit
MRPWSDRRVELENGQSVTYDPRRLKGVHAFREVTREFATGDRIQFTAQDRNLDVANRDLATITRIEPGQITVLLDGKTKRSLTFDPEKVRSLDHGYAVTSHSSQGLTAGRVIANIDTESGRNLINTRLAYVSISRASEEARVYTNDASTLGARLATDKTKTAAVDFSQQIKREPAEKQQTQTISERTTHQYSCAQHRLAAVALDYVAQPNKTVVIAPDSNERREPAITQVQQQSLSQSLGLGF